MKKTLFASALALVFASTTAFAAPAVPPVPAHKAPSQNVTHKKVTHKKVTHKTSYAINLSKKLSKTLLENR